MDETIIIIEYFLKKEKKTALLHKLWSRFYELTTSLIVLKEPKRKINKNNNRIRGNFEINEALKVTSKSSD